MQELKEQALYPTCFTDGKGEPKAIKSCDELKTHRALSTSTFNKPEDDDQCDGKGHGHGHH